MNKVAQSSDKPVVLLSSQPEKKTIKCMIFVPKVFYSKMLEVSLISPKYIYQKTSVKFDIVKGFMTIYTIPIYPMPLYY